jgi:peptidoglycan L-alanyl-D-glutamate endopeptidase CwlK
MINSRKLEDLLPIVKSRVDLFLDLCKQSGIDVIITSTYRDTESQDALYAQGRTIPGSVVTKAKGGESFHNYRCAVDIVPIINGKADWNGSHPVWAKLGELGKEAGLDWAGGWKTFKELAHFQYTNGLTIKDLKAGRQIS